VLFDRDALHFRPGIFFGFFETLDQDLEDGLSGEERIPFGFPETPPDSPGQASHTWHGEGNMKQIDG
jgi:hypothetical protein